MEFKDLDWDEKRTIWSLRALSNVIEAAGENSLDGYNDWIGGEDLIGLGNALKVISQKVEGYLVDKEASQA